MSVTLQPIDQIIVGMSGRLYYVLHCSASFLSQHAANCIGLSAVSHTPLVTSTWRLSTFLFLWLFSSLGYLRFTFTWRPSTLFLFFCFGLFCFVETVVFIIFSH